MLDPRLLDLLLLPQLLPLLLLQLLLLMLLLQLLLLPQLLPPMLLLLQLLLPQLLLPMLLLLQLLLPQLLPQLAPNPRLKMNLAMLPMDTKTSTLPSRSLVMPTVVWLDLTPMLMRLESTLSTMLLTTSQLAQLT